MDFGRRGESAVGSSDGFCQGGKTLGGGLGLDLLFYRNLAF